MNPRVVVRITRNFERNLDEIERFLATLENAHGFDALLEELSDTAIPTLEAHPDIGRDFLARVVDSAEAEMRLRTVERLLADFGIAACVREYVMSHHLVLYAHVQGAVHLLSIRHQRQHAFDMGQRTGTAD